MLTTSYTLFRQNLKRYMERVNHEEDALVVTSKDDRNVVVMSQDSYDSMVEHLHLFGSTANRKHIDDSLAEIDSGASVKMNLEDL